MERVVRALALGSLLAILMSIPLAQASCPSADAAACIRFADTPSSAATPHSREHALLAPLASPGVFRSSSHTTLATPAVRTGSPRFSMGAVVAVPNFRSPQSGATRVASGRAPPR